MNENKELLEATIKGLDKEQIMAIMTNYEQLKEKYDE